MYLVLFSLYMFELPIKFIIIPRPQDEEGASLAGQVEVPVERVMEHHLRKVLIPCLLLLMYYVQIMHSFWVVPWLEGKLFSYPR